MRRTEDESRVKILRDEIGEAEKMLKRWTDVYDGQRNLRLPTRLKEGVLMHSIVV